MTERPGRTRQPDEDVRHPYAGGGRVEPDVSDGRSLVSRNTSAGTRGRRAGRFAVGKAGASVTVVDYTERGAPAASRSGGRRDAVTLIRLPCPTDDDG